MEKQKKGVRDCQIWRVKVQAGFQGDCRAMLVIISLEESVTLRVRYGDACRIYSCRVLLVSIRKGLILLCHWKLGISPSLKPTSKFVRE